VAVRRGAVVSRGWLRAKRLILSRIARPSSRGNLPRCALIGQPMHRHLGISGRTC
jgi:hypothetical protein